MASEMCHRAFLIELKDNALLMDKLESELKVIALLIDSHGI